MIRNCDPRLASQWSIGNQFDQRAWHFCLREFGPKAGSLLNTKRADERKRGDGPTVGVSRAGGNPSCDDTRLFASPTECTLLNSNPRSAVYDRPNNGLKRGSTFRAFTQHSFVSWEARVQGCNVGTALEAVGEGIVCRFRQEQLNKVPAIYRASLVGDQAMMKRRLGAVN